MDLYHRRSLQEKGKTLLTWAINCVNAILLSTHSANAQTNLPSINSLDGLPLRDLTGLALPNAVGSRFTVDLPDGTRCSSEDGTPTTLNFYSGISQRQDEVDHSSAASQTLYGNGSGYALGAVLSIPLSTKNTRNCDKAYSISILNKKLELATLLHEEGLLSDEDLSEFLAQVKKVILDE